MGSSRFRHWDTRKEYEKSAGLNVDCRTFLKRAIFGGMKSFLIRWLVTTFAVAVAAKLPGIQAEGWWPLVCMALFLGVINAVIRPALLFLSIPFIIVTLGFFILVVNTLTFWLAGGLVPGFHVAGFWNAFFGSIVVSIVSWALSGFVRGSDGQMRVLTRHDRFQAPGEKRVQGRVIE
jgi:putative membrane protein